MLTNKKWRAIRLIAAALLVLSLFCTIDLGLNVLYNAEPDIHDGSYGTHSILHAVFGIFGDSLWSFDRFFLAFQRSTWVTYLLLIVNAVLHFFKGKER